LVNVVPFVKVHLRGDPARDKDVRDPVHGDIELREHEQHIVNTAIFQRLHGIRQLGFAYHVYPGASHNRFQHSLGTLHMAQRIAEAIERGAVKSAKLAHRVRVVEQGLQHHGVRRPAARGLPVRSGGAGG